MHTDDFDYELPPELIAQTPAEPRDTSRLLILDRGRGRVEHRTFADIGAYLRPGDLLVVNDTRVLRARLRGTLAVSGGNVEALLLRDLGVGRWEALVRPGRRLLPGRRIIFSRESRSVEAEVEGVLDGGERILRFEPDSDPEALGDTPLPPYIRAPLADAERYQTVYARERGSAAAPTAGLHFTPALLERLRGDGVGVASVTLHIGPGTFRPVKSGDPRDHPMHAEFYHLGAEAAATLAATRERGGRIICVGTTVVRVLEHIAGLTNGAAPAPGDGWTRLLILPGHSFRLVDGLITNFHLPRSTLLMLVSALAGRDAVLAAYREAVAMHYRFFSFGDAMLVL